MRRIFPEEGLSTGPVRIHPFLGLAQVFTDNVFRTNSGRESDFVTVIAPGVQAQLPLGGRHQFVAHYNASRLIYVRTPGNDALVQDAWGRIDLNFPGGLRMDFQGGRTEGFVPRGSTLDIQQAEITKWNTNTFIGQAELFGTVAGIRLTARSTRWNFENNDQAPARDRLTNGVALTVFRAITSKTFALLNVGLTDRIYDQNKQLDSLTFNVGTGLRFAATGKTTGEFRIGYQVLNFDRAPVATPPAPGLSVGGDKQEILNIVGRILWQPTSRLTINLSPFRTIQQAAVFDTSVFTQTGVALNALQTIGARTALIGTFRFSDDDFDSPILLDGEELNRADTRFDLGIGIGYRILEWLGLNVSYFYQQRASTVAQFDFDANSIKVSIEAFR